MNINIVNTKQVHIVSFILFLIEFIRHKHDQTYNGSIQFSNTNIHPRKIQTSVCKMKTNRNKNH